MEYVPKVWNQRQNLKLRQGENTAPTLEVAVDNVLRTTYVAYLRQECRQLEICDFSGENFKGFEVL